MTSRARPRILITRPTGQHAQLREGCQALGLDAVHCPCLVIEPLLAPDVATKLSGVAGPVLFTSANAVRCAHQIRSLPWSQTNSYAIGEASARLLDELGQPVDVRPRTPYNSESCLSLLTESPLRVLSIIKGMGGRTLIRDTLIDRGWQVRTVDVYQRRRPSPQEAATSSVFGAGSFDLISVGSDEVLLNLLALSKDWHEQLFQARLIVNSSRCAQLAQRLGFIKSAIVAEYAGDEGQLQCVRQWMEKHQQVS